MAKKNAAGPGSKKVAAQQTNQAESTTAAIVAPMPRILTPQNSMLLRLPEEVKQKIYKLAVKADDDIVPMQIREKSNKFIWSKKQLIDAKDRYTLPKKIVSAVPPLTAISLAQTCHQVYDEVSLTNLFYQVNSFDFEECSNNDALAYLVAITDARRNNIRSIRIGWDYFQSENVLTMLASCKNIETFEVVVGEYTYHHWCHKARPELGSKNTFNLLLLALQGVKNIKLTIPSDDAYNVTDPTLKAHRNKVAATIIAELQGQSKVERGKNLSLDKLNKARLAADLHVHGEGRLGDDKKPGVIASRTRQQIKNAEKLDADGVIPEPEKPKYAVDGDLAWWVSKIKASREVLDTDGSVSSVEFLVVCRPERSHYMTDITQETWEDLSVLNSLNARHNILDFYFANSGSGGKQTVVDVWKLLSDEDDLPRYASNSQMVKRLQMIIKKDAKDKEKLEEARAKKAQIEASKKATKIALKSKKVAKKTKRGESA